MCFILDFFKSIWNWLDDWNALAVFYDAYKTSFFTASITMGTFLFSMSTFIIQIMKKEVYDKSAYKKSRAERKKQDKTASYYGPLNRLRWALTASIAICFSSAVFQLVVGAFQGTVLIGMSRQLLKLRRSFPCATFFH